MLYLDVELSEVWRLNLGRHHQSNRQAQWAGNYIFLSSEIVRNCPASWLRREISFFRSLNGRRHLAIRRVELLAETLLQKLNRQGHPVKRIGQLMAYFSRCGSNSSQPLAFRNCSCNLVFSEMSRMNAA